MSGSAKAGTNAERHTRELGASEILRARSPERASGRVFFLLTKTYTDVGNTEVIRARPIRVPNGVAAAPFLYNPAVALVVFLRGINVGGYRAFRPSIVAKNPPNMTS